MVIAQWPKKLHKHKEVYEKFDREMRRDLTSGNGLYCLFFSFALIDFSSYSFPSSSNLQNYALATILHPPFNQSLNRKNHKLLTNCTCLICNPLDVLEKPSFELDVNILIFEISDLHTLWMRIMYSSV